MPIIASSFLFTVLYGVGTYTALAFLGLVNLRLELGRHAVLRPVGERRADGYWWWFIPPGLAIALLGTALALLNFGIDEFINPRLRSPGWPAPTAPCRRQARIRAPRLLPALADTRRATPVEAPGRGGGK